MPEPPTHYQLSFTVRQAMALFVGLLLALAAAYFFGLLTGMSGRAPAAEGTAAVPSPAPTPSTTASERIAAVAPSPQPTSIRPPASSPIPPFPRPVLGKEPTGKPSITFFEDSSEGEAAPAARPAERAAASKTPNPKTPAPRTPSSKSETRVRPATPGPAEAGELWIQVTSVRSEREARARRDKLIHRGYRARVVVAESPKGNVYRVRVGPYTSREEASRASDRLSREEKVQTWIVPAGK